MCDITQCAIEKNSSQLKNFTLVPWAAWATNISCASREGSRYCRILQSQIGEHGVSLENMEKMENFNQITSNTLFITQSTLFVTQNIIFVNQMAQNALFYSIYRHVGKIITCMRLENMTLCQLKLGERQTTCRGLHPDK